jgi:hypothetical protein
LPAAGPPASGRIVPLQDTVDGGVVGEAIALAENTLSIAAPAAASTATGTV